MTKYIGITIGPIGDTLGEVSTPAALWFGSYMFSDITRRICMKLDKEDSLIGTSIRIHSPYYSEEISLKDGIGKFHDRIIFSAKELREDKLQEMIRKVKKETINGFVEPEDGEQKFLEEYLQIQYVILSGEQVGSENCILKISPYLDAMELMKTFPRDNQKNPLRRMFLGEKNSKNIKIKKSPWFKQIEDRASKKQFVCKQDGQDREERIRSVEDIAAIGKGKENLKKYQYFAVVQSDGDGMTGVLKVLKNEKITYFSRACLKYAEEAAKKVAEFGGMTIYAGGDDLLFLSPIEGNNGQNVFELCQLLGEMFQNTLKQEDELKNLPTLPTVSFGIAIQHVKYPLYETKKIADELLGAAKGKNGKNNMTIRLLKHSGQSIEFCIKNKTWSGENQSVEYENFQKLLHMRQGNKADEEQILHGLWHTLFQYKSVIEEMDRQLEEEDYINGWLNLFDNPSQESVRSYVCNVAEIYYSFLKNSNVGENEKEEDKEDGPRKTLFGMLRMKQFLVEKGDER